MPSSVLEAEDTAMNEACSQTHKVQLMGRRNNYKVIAIMCDE